MMETKQVVCAVSGTEYTKDRTVPVSTLDSLLRTFLQHQYPTLTQDSLVGLDQLPKLRSQLVSQLLEDEAGKLSILEQKVVESIKRSSILSEDVEEEIDRRRSVGEQVAVVVAAFGGSWTFITWFFIIMIGWMILNVFWLNDKGFDPYPFILLNLILSCLAAIQAPIIMMSQNRQEAKDRIRREQDYKINLKAELEIKLLHKKMDHIMEQQNRRLLDIQLVQTEMLRHLSAPQVFPTPSGTTL
ncbi:DUF1003 domain-containing protein [Spirosoma arcticum]